MFSTTSHLSPADRRFLAQLQQLDLQPIADKLTTPAGMASPIAAQPMQHKLMAYLQFLFLMYRYPKLTLVPPKAIVPVWQAHILDTRKYYQDCQRLFGCLDLAHHQACLLPLSSTDQQQLMHDFATTCALFEKHFDTNVFTVLTLDQPGTCLRPSYQAS
ncbi:hypothetical protein [Trichothermofontia sp.]